MSFELRDQFDKLNEYLSDDENEIILEDWQFKYHRALREFEKKRVQIIQDEYIAKLIQNEEFLNELKKNQDFIQTLDSG